MRRLLRFCLGMIVLVAVIALSAYAPVALGYALRAAAGSYARPLVFGLGLVVWLYFMNRRPQGIRQ